MTRIPEIASADGHGLITFPLYEPKNLRASFQGGIGNLDIINFWEAEEARSYLGIPEKPQRTRGYALDIATALAVFEFNLANARNPRFLRFIPSSLDLAKTDLGFKKLEATKLDKASKAIDAVLEKAKTGYPEIYEAIVLVRRFINPSQIAQAYKAELFEKLGSQSLVSYGNVLIPGLGKA